MRILPIALELVAACVAAAPAPAQQAVLLRLMPPVGQITHYRLAVQSWVRIPGLTPPDTTKPTVAETMYMTRNVIARHAGTFTAETTIDSSSMVLEGTSNQGGDLLRGMVIRQITDSLGQVDSTDVTPPPSASPMEAQTLKRSGGINASNLSMPAGPVRVGDSWTDSTSVALPGMSGQQTVRGRVTYRLERLEQEAGHRVAVLSSTMTIALADTGTSMSADGVVRGLYRLDLDAGRLLHATTDMTMRLATSEGEGSSRVHVVIEIVH